MCSLRAAAGAKKEGDAGRRGESRDPCPTHVTLHWDEALYAQCMIRARYHQSANKWATNVGFVSRAQPGGNRPRRARKPDRITWD